MATLKGSPYVRPFPTLNGSPCVRPSVGRAFQARQLRNEIERPRFGLERRPPREQSVERGPPLGDGGGQLRRRRDVGPLQQAHQLTQSAGDVRQRVRAFRRGAAAAASGGARLTFERAQLLLQRLEREAFR